MAGLTNILYFFNVLCTLSHVFAAPIPFNIGIYTLAYRDLFDLSTHQSKRAGDFTLPPLPYAYDVSKH